MYNVSLISKEGEIQQQISNNIPDIEILKRDKVFQTCEHIHILDLENKFVITFDKDRVIDNTNILPITLIRSNYEPVLNFIKRRINSSFNKDIQINEIRLLDVYKKICTLPSTEDTSIYDIFNQNGLGFRLNKIIENQEFNFINTIRALQFNPVHIRQTIKSLIVDTQKIHIFLDTEKDKMLDYLKLRKHLINFQIVLQTDVNRSMFQKFRTFVNESSFSKFEKTIYNVITDPDKYSKIFKYLLDIGRYFPTINLKAIKLNPTEKEINMRILNTPLKASKFDDYSMSFIFACIEIAGQTKQLMNNIEKIKLLNC